MSVLTKPHITNDTLPMLTIKSKLVLIAQVLNVSNLNLLSLTFRQILININVNRIDVIKWML